MPGVFISYRRDDTQGFAGRLADDLGDMLGPDSVFRDIEIPIGSDFTDVLERAIAASDALLVVIGRHWAGASADGFRSRLFEPTDWVRAEIEAAFEQDKVVVPVLVGGTAMPAGDDLPESIARLTRLQAASLSDRHWDSEVSELAERLRRRTAAPSPGDVMRELGDRVFDELSSRDLPHRVSPPRSGSAFGRLGRRFLAWLWGGVRKLLTIALVIGLVYGGMRLFGDQQLLRQLDAFEARLQVGWDRFNRYVGQL